jgi:hypothetical protein
MREHMVSSKAGMRIAPKMSPGAYRTFEVQAPPSTHFRNASCAEVECQHYLSGWMSRVDISTQQGVQWGKAIHNSGRKYTVEQEGTVFTFRFGPGQQCFQSPHKVRLERPELYVIRDGDWRANPTGHVRRERQPMLFVEQMEDQLSRLRREVERG